MKSFVAPFRLFACQLMLLGGTLAVGTIAFHAAPAQAQQRGPVQRVVQGKITDKSDAPLTGAVVYLKNSQSLAVKSAITSEDGTYRFGQLTANTDYEVWAESNGKKSNTKNISSFDTKATFYINLKIDTTK